MLLGEDTAVKHRSTAHYGSSLSEGHPAVLSMPHEAPMVRDYAALHPLTIWLSWGLRQHIVFDDTIRYADVECDVGCHPDCGGRMRCWVPPVYGGVM